MQKNAGEENNNKLTPSQIKKANEMLEEMKRKSSSAKFAAHRSPVYGNKFKICTIVVCKNRDDKGLNVVSSESGEYIPNEIMEGTIPAYNGGNIETTKSNIKKEK